MGFVEFASASSTSSALLFDRTKIAGRTVSVAVVEEDLPDAVWVAAPADEADLEDYKNTHKEAFIEDMTEKLQRKPSGRQKRPRPTQESRSVSKFMMQPKTPQLRLKCKAS